MSNATLHYIASLYNKTQLKLNKLSDLTPNSSMNNDLHISHITIFVNLTLIINNNMILQFHNLTPFPMTLLHDSDPSIEQNRQASHNCTQAFPHLKHDNQYSNRVKWDLFNTTYVLYHSGPQSSLKGSQWLNGFNIMFYWTYYNRI